MGKRDKDKMSFRGQNRNYRPGNARSAEQHHHHPSNNHHSAASQSQHLHHHHPQSSSNNHRHANSNTGGKSNKNSSKQSLNHLLNFNFPPRQRPSASAPRRGTRLNSSGSREFFNKEKFVNANYRFVVKQTGDYTIQLYDPDVTIDWGDIEQVLLTTSNPPSCPICLSSTPLAPHITKCGHTFCYPCIVQYLTIDPYDPASQNNPDLAATLKKRKWRKCPICWESVYENDLRSVKIIAADGVAAADDSVMSPVPSDFEDGFKDKTLVKLRLMSRHVSSILVAPRSEPFSDLLSPPPHYQNYAFTFAKLVLASPEYITQEILQKDIDAIQHERKEISDLLSSIHLARQLAREPSPSPPSSASSSLSSSNPWHRNPIVPPPKPPSPTLAPLPPESESSSTELFYLELAVSKLQSKLEFVLESITSSPTIDVDKIVSVSNEVKKKMVEDELRRRENERLEMSKHEEERKLAIERELKRVQKQLRDSEMYEPAFSDEEYYDISHEESYPTESEMEDDEPIFDYSPPGSPMVSVSKSRKNPKNVSIRISKDDSSNSSSSAATSPTFINPSSSSSSSKHSANASTKSNAAASAANAKTETFYFYQHAAGLYIYLHPLDIKILKHEFGNYNLFPDELTVKIVSVQETTMDEDLRRKCRYLSHLPKGCDVGFVEVDLNGVVGKETLEAFKDELSTRIHRRKSKFQQEEKARRLVERKLALQQSESSPRMVPSPGTSPSFPSLSSSFPGSSSLSLDYYNMGSGFGDGEVPSPVLSPVEFPAFPALSNRSASDRGHDRVRGKDKEKQRVQSTSTNDKSLPIPVASSSASPSSNPSSNTVSPVDSLLASSSALYPTPSSPLSSSLTHQQTVNSNSTNPWNSSTRTSFAKIVGTGYNGLGSGGSSGSMKWEKQSVKKTEESKNKIEVQLDWGAGLGGLVVEQSEIEKDRNPEKRDGESGFKNDETEDGKVQPSVGKKKKKGKVVLVSTGGARRY